MSIESDKLIFARIKDAIRMTESKNIPSFLGFLNNLEFSICKSYLEKEKINFSYFGGYDDAERFFVAILPEWAEEVEYPFSCLKFSYKSIYELSHRDFLGALMSLGIERDKVGDIIVKKGEAFVFVCKSIEKFCFENISKVGSVGVNISLFEDKVELDRNFEIIYKTIASNRVDCVVGAICNFSREKAKEYILSGNLVVNHIICESVTKLINKDDILSIRKKGKFIICEIDEKTKKGRLKLTVKKYI